VTRQAECDGEMIDLERIKSRLVRSSAHVCAALMSAQRHGLPAYFRLSFHLQSEPCDGFLLTIEAQASVASALQQLFLCLFFEAAEMTFGQRKADRVHFQHDHSVKFDGR